MGGQAGQVSARIFAKQKGALKMPKVKQISVGASFTKNLGNFQSLKVEANIVMELHDGDDPDEAYADAWARVQEQIRNGLGKGQPK